MQHRDDDRALTVSDLTVENAQPVNLFSIACLPNQEDYKESSELKQNVRDALKPFAKMIRKNGSNPLLCELAVISDKNQWQHVVDPGDSREFVSIIDTYEDELSPELRQELIVCWKAAIRSLGNSQPSRVQANYIVLNERVYDAVTYYEKFISQDSSSSNPGQQETYCKNAPEAESNNAPEAEIEHFSIDEKARKPLANAAQDNAAQKAAQKAINDLIQGTLLKASQGLKNALRDATLVILPFSRPYVDTTMIDNDKISKNPNDAGLSILLDPNIEKGPGGCLFAIYKNSTEESGSSDLASAQPSDLNFFLAAQYLLTLSALVEARRNLVLYYEEQRKRNWGYLVHQFKNDVAQPLTTLSQVHQVVKENGDFDHELVSKVELAEGQMDSMFKIADLVVAATKTTAEGGRKELTNNSIRYLLHHFEEDMLNLADLESKYLELYGDGGKLSIEFGKPDLDDALIKRMTIVKDAGYGRSVDHIGEFRKIICHEVIKNIRSYAYFDSESSEKIRSAKCGLFFEGEWVYFVCQNYIRDGKNKQVKMTVLDGAKELQQIGGRAFRFGNCMGQFRVGMSVLHAPPDIEVEVLESSHPPVFTIAIPVGKFKSEDGGLRNS